MNPAPRPRSATSPPPGLLDLLARLGERGLADHGMSVAGLVARAARVLALSESLSARIELAALLHDVGKVELPPSVLDHPGALSSEQWAQIRSHPARGERLVLAVPGLERIAPIVRHHHERWDGFGYPDGLAGSGIPLGARIVHACDAFDAMTETRSYRAPVSVEEACCELTRCAGQQFDPVVVRVVVNLIRHT